jgi:hypothetical protein
MPLHEFPLSEIGWIVARRAGSEALDRERRIEAETRLDSGSSVP